MMNVRAVEKERSRRKARRVHRNTATHSTEEETETERRADRPQTKRPGEIEDKECKEENKREGGRRKRRSGLGERYVEPKRCKEAEHMS